MIKNKKGNAVYIFLLACVTLVIFWLVYIVLWPIAIPFLSSANLDPIWYFFILIIPIWMLFMITYSIMVGGA